MGCDYQYYKESETYYPYIYCKLDDKRCLYSKRCELKQRFIPLGNENECYKYNEQLRKNIPTGSYYVISKRQNKHGTFYIYVECNGENKRFEYNKDIEQNYVYIKNVDNEFVISTTPFE
jgi:hypothetical protein